jgi:hypothetical protein
MDRIYSGLTALERARLVLRTWHDGVRENPAWRLTMPARQGNQFNQYIYVMNAANMHVAQMINSLDADRDLLWEWLYRFSMLEEWLIDLMRDAPSAARGARQRAQHKDAVQRAAARREQLEQALATLEGHLVRGASRAWANMRAIEVGLDEMTAQFDGTDPLKPSHRQHLQEIRESLDELIDCMADFEPSVERREPDEEMLSLVRSTVPAMRMMMG